MRAGRYRVVARGRFESAGAKCAASIRFAVHANVMHTALAGSSDVWRRTQPADLWAGTWGRQQRCLMRLMTNLGVGQKSDSDGNAVRDRYF